MSAAPDHSASTSGRPNGERISLRIDGQTVEVAPGTTLLQAARQIGLRIPTLCYDERCSPSTSCLVCLVKVKSAEGGRMVPSCATRAEPGMEVESETPEVFDARRTALELLFSDHLGDCLSPCHRICPLQLNIPQMLRQVQAEQWPEAVATVRTALPLAAITGRYCTAPCEQGCRRGVADEPAAIRDIERFVADRDLASPEPWLPPMAADTGESLAVVGAGPAGLIAAHDLRRAGHRVVVYDRHPHPGGSLRTEVAQGRLPETVLAGELRRLEQMGIEFHPKRALGTDLSLEELLDEHRAVLLALGDQGRQQAPALGLAFGPSGVKVDTATYLTSRARVFACGAMVRSIAQVVRAMAEGRAAAQALNQFLAGQKIQRLPKPFSSIMGKTTADEVQQFLRLAQPVGRVLRAETAPQPPAELVRTEASRCLHCDCRSVGQCDLQYWAELYGVDPNRFRGERRPFEQHLQHGQIIFEPGKCILCEICIKIAEQAREPLGLTFIGRGFDVRVGVPFSRTIDEGLQKVARECVEACPTGALVFKDDYLRQMAGFHPKGGCSG